MGIFDWRVKKRGAPTPPAPLRAKPPAAPSEPPRNALSPLWSSWPSEPTKAPPSKVPTAPRASEPPIEVNAPMEVNAPSAVLPTPALHTPPPPPSFAPPPLAPGEPAVAVTRARPISEPVLIPNTPRPTSSAPPPGSSPRLAPIADARTPGSSMRVALQAGDWEAALAIAQALLAEHPGHADARAAAERCREQLLGLYTRRLGARERVLRVTVPDTWLAQLAIDPRAAFLLSRIDGTCTIEEVIDMSCMPELDAMGLLVDMLEEGVIEASVRAPTMRPPR